MAEPQAIDSMEWGESFREPRRDPEVERDVRQAGGLTPIAAVRLLAPCPWLARGIATGNYRNGQLVHIENDLADMTFLAVSQDNSCRYCYAGQRGLLRVMGFDEQRIRSVEDSSLAAEADSPEQLALDFAEGAIAMECPTGSVAMWDGRVWHGSWPRSIDGQRVVLHAGYYRLVMRPSADYSDFAEDLIARYGPRMSQLLGEEDYMYKKNFDHAKDHEKFARTLINARS